MERRHLEGRLAESLSHLTDIEREERLEDRIKKSTARLAELARPGAAQTLLQAEEQYLAHLQEALASRNSAHLKVSRQQTEESISEAKRLHEMALSEIEDLACDATLSLVGFVMSKRKLIGVEHALSTSVTSHHRNSTTSSNGQTLCLGQLREIPSSRGDTPLWPLKSMSRSARQIWSW
jgi:hypothetical protein